jgi:N4-gp56 family major capsid protein
MFTIEETLAATDIVTALTTGPYLIYSEVFEGARRPLVWLTLCKEDFSLIGVAGNVIKFMTATQLSASSDTEANVLGTGMTAADKTVTSASLTVANPIWSATQLSDILLEDYPNVDWLRLNLRNMGAAVMEYLDDVVYDVFAAASSTVTHSTTAGLTYGEVVDALAKMENNSWIADSGVAPFLVVAPETAAVLLKDTSFVDARRYTTNEISRMVEGEIGMFAGCRVLKTPLLDGYDHAYIVFPNDGPNGPVAILAWKRKMTVRNERNELKGYGYYVASIRANAAVVQAKGECIITLTTGTP